MPSEQSNTEEVTPLESQSERPASRPGSLFTPMLMLGFSCFCSAVVFGIETTVPIMIGMAVLCWVAYLAGRSAHL